MAKGLSANQMIAIQAAVLLAIISSLSHIAIIHMSFEEVVKVCLISIVVLLAYQVSISLAQKQELECLGGEVSMAKAKQSHIEMRSMDQTITVEYVANV